MSSKLFPLRSLKTRVTLFTLAIFVASIWVLSFYANRMLRGDMEQLLGEQQFSTVSLVAANINQEISDRMAALVSAAASIDAKRMNNTAALQSILENHPILPLLFNGGFFITGIDGAATASVPLSAERTGINYMDRNHVATALKEGRSAVSTVIIGKTLHVPVVSLAVPIRDPQGKVIGTLVGTINLVKTNFLDQVTGNPYGKTGGYLLVAPQQRLIITATDKRRIMETLPPPGVSPKLDRFVEGYEGSDVLVNPHGVEVLVSAKGIPVAGWYLATLLPTAEAFAPIHAMQKHMLLATLLLTLLAGGLTWWILSRQLTPILAATKTLGSLSDATTPPQPLPITSQDEVGDLIRSFNRLLETVRTREEALRLNQIMLARTEGIAHIGSWEWHVATDTVKWSDELFRIFQRNPADGAPSFAEHSTLYFPDDMQRLQEAVSLTLSHGTPYELELRTIRHDGMTRVCLAHGQAEMDEDRKVTLLFGLLQDITERKQAEAKLEQYHHHLEALVQERTVALTIAKELAEAANRAKSRFLANMSHELRTPMNAIMGMTSIALRRVEDPKLRDQLGKIDKASQHLLAVINDILDISKIEAERLTLDQSNFMLGEVLENLTSLIGQKVKDKGLELRINLAPPLARLALRGDALRLGQILLNLTTNAVKFTEAGSITLRAHPIEESPADVLLRFEVQDTGIGISPEDQKRLFTAFEQADGSMTRKYGGTGLGLAISKRLAKLMGGDIGVDSQPGAGSTFWFSVRLAKTTDAVSPAPTFTGDTANGLRTHADSGDDSECL